MRVSKCLVSGVAFSAVAAETAKLYHRVVSQDGTSSPFTLRGTVEIDSALAISSSARAAVYSPAGESLQDDVRQILDRATKEPRSLYQVALERAHDTAEDQWPVSSAKLVRALGDLTRPDAPGVVSLADERGRRCAAARR